MMFAQLRDCSRIILFHGAQQILGLMFELIEVGTDGKVAIVELLGHNGPPSWSCPGSAAAGEKEVRENLGFREFAQVDSVLSADGRRPVRRGQYSAGFQTRAGLGSGEQPHYFFVPFTDFDAGHDIGSGRRSDCVLEDIRPEINWLHSYVTGDKSIACTLRPTGRPFANTRAAEGFPANRVSAVRHLIDPGAAG